MSMPDTRPDPSDLQAEVTSPLGEKLRHLRKKRGLTLSQLAEMTGCSESMLSKAERGHVVPSLDLLSRIAMQLGTSIAGLFSESAELTCFVYKEGERPALELGTATPRGHTVLERLIPYTKGRQLNANLHVVPPGGGSAGVLSHAGEEVGFVIEGYIEITVDNERHLVGPGGSFFFHSELPHSYRNVGSTSARIVWVNSPPY
jgi:transcriptional regulator with XRE-family HTH domain